MNPGPVVPSRSAGASFLRGLLLNAGAAILVIGAGECATRLVAESEEAGGAMAAVGIAGAVAPEASHEAGATFRWFGQRGAAGGAPEFDHEVTNNRFGFHGPDHPPRRAPGVKRVAILGDSFVEALQVERSELMASRVETMLGGVEVLEFGRAAHSTTRQGLLLDALPGLLSDKDGPDGPDVIVFQCHGPFALRQALGDEVLRAALWKRAMMKALYSIGNRSRFLAMARTSVLRLLEETTAATLDRAGRCFDRGPTPDITRQGWAVVDGAVKTLADRARAAGAVPVFMYLPRPDEMKPATDTFDPRAPARRFQEMAREAHAGWIDLTPDFLGATGRGLLHFPVDTHLTPLGHRVAAEGLSRGLAPLLERK